VNKEPGVSRTPIRRRAARALLAGSLSLVVLAGCTTTQRDASNYEDTEEDFLEGCIATAEADAEVEGAAVIASPEDYCQCAFDGLVESVEFDRFKEVNTELREEGGALPDDIAEVYAACAEGR
jgi:hypothetical protein